MGNQNCHVYKTGLLHNFQVAQFGYIISIFTGIVTITAQRKTLNYSNK